METDDRAVLVDRMLGMYLETLQSDPVVGRAYQVEIDALGAPARERRRTSLDGLARYLQEITARTAPETDLPFAAYLGVVCAARQLADDALDVSAEPDLQALRADLRRWLAAVFRAR